MRTLLIVALIAAAAAAQDAAAELFYKAFWLEQAGGKLKESEAIYEEIVAKHPDSAEAPRALVGLMRVRVARNENVEELVAQLEKSYPDAEQALKDARKILSLYAKRFDPEPHADDAPVISKIKSLYNDSVMMAGDHGIGKEDMEFLIDVGPVAHPMLDTLLRSDDAADTRIAATILLRQRIPESDRLIARALNDDSIIFRGSIAQALSDQTASPIVLVRGLARLYETAAPRMRGLIVAALTSMVHGDGEGRDLSFALLERALADEDGQVRGIAASVVSQIPERVPDSFVDALLKRVEAGDGAIKDSVVDRLPLYADRPGLFDRVLAVWKDRRRLGRLGDPETDEGALIVARTALAHFAAGARDADIWTMLRASAMWSPRAAAEILRHALAHGDAELVNVTVDAIVSRRDLRTHLSGVADGLIIDAVRRNNAAAQHLLRKLALRPADHGKIIAALKEGGGLPAPLRDRDYLQAIGPERAGALVKFCADDEEVRVLLRAGSPFYKEAGGQAFFDHVIPRVGPDAVRDLRGFAKEGLLRVLIAKRLLGAKSEAWGWDVPHNPRWDGDTQRAHPGPYAWSAIHEHAGEEPLRSLLVEYIDDPRAVIAASAARAAAAIGLPDARAVLQRALASKHGAVRATALGALATGEGGAQLVRDFMKGRALEAADRAAILRALTLSSREGDEYTKLIRELLETRKQVWASLFDAYYATHPEEAVAFAAVEALGSGESNFKMAALRLLTRVPDKRRIPVFREVLQKGTDYERRLVILAVRDQYLIELGEETLQQLRSPDSTTRAFAHDAIEKLKFYAEARKAFDK